MAEQYLKSLKDILGESVAFQSSIGGELIISKLSVTDYDLLKQFSNKMGTPLNDCELFNKDKFAKLALIIKKVKEVGNKIFKSRSSKLLFKIL